jgi:hypothetical protein
MGQGKIENDHCGNQGTCSEAELDLHWNMNGLSVHEVLTDLTDFTPDAMTDSSSGHTLVQCCLERLLMIFNRTPIPNDLKSL